MFPIAKCLFFMVPKKYRKITAKIDKKSRQKVYNKKCFIHKIRLRIFKIISQKKKHTKKQKPIFRWKREKIQ